MNSKTRGFPIINYITLDLNSARSLNLNRVSKELGIKSIPFVAKRGDFTNIRLLPEQKNTLTVAELGCMSSHLRLLEKLVNDDNIKEEDFFMICEDDVDLSWIEIWNFRWQEVLYLLPKNVEYVSFHTGLCLNKVIPGTKRNFSKFFNFSAIPIKEGLQKSATSYMIKKSAARKIYDRHFIEGKWQFNNIEPIDVFYMHFIAMISYTIPILGEISLGDSSLVNVGMVLRQRSVGERVMKSTLSSPMEHHIVPVRYFFESFKEFSGEICLFSLIILITISIVKNKE